mmetsp:Transcript_43610/g.141534  ORF Transcript_43610/g.141534 Transcript_43610/m.141534 type:complete len:204 (+) Transcript_43610:427-1038(+)
MEGGGAARGGDLARVDAAVLAYTALLEQMAQLALEGGRVLVHAIVHVERRTGDSRDERRPEPSQCGDEAARVVGRPHKAVRRASHRGGLVCTVEEFGAHAVWEDEGLGGRRDRLLVARATRRWATRQALPIPIHGDTHPGGGRRDAEEVRMRPALHGEDVEALSQVHHRRVARGKARVAEVQVDFRVDERVVQVVHNRRRAEL